MKNRFILFLSILFLTLAVGCKSQTGNKINIGDIKSYKDIPGVTEEEIDAVEALKNSRDFFSYGHLIETEGFEKEDGTYGGFTINFCGLLTELFGIEFRHVSYAEWDRLLTEIGSHELDFTGVLTSTPERRQVYYMTHSIAERTISIFMLKGGYEPEKETDVNGMRIGLLSGTITADYIREAYPNLDFEHVFADTTAEGVRMLESGEIDLFMADSILGIAFEDYDEIYSKEFFSMVYTPASMSTANIDLSPIISVVNKYIAAGGIDKLDELYKAGDFEYAKHRLDKSFTAEEREYLKRFSSGEDSVVTGFESDNYPYSFFNEEEGEYQGIAIDILAEISTLTGINFSVGNNKSDNWATIFDKLRNGELSMVSQLLHSGSREEDFIWSSVPYATAYYALLSRTEYPDTKIYQVIRAKVGTLGKTGFEDVYYGIFPERGNLIIYETFTDAFEALDSGEIELFMASEGVLLSRTNYHEKPGYKVNVRIEKSADSFFGFNKNEDILRSIIDKAQVFVDTDIIERSWKSRFFDYEKKIALQRSSFLMVTSICLALILVGVVFLFFKYKRAEESARIASKAKSVFLAQMSHEIRTPLHAIIGMAEIAKSSVTDNEKAVTAIGRVISSSRHLLSILNDVLDMSKIESGKLELIRKPFSLSELSKEVSGIFSQSCAEKDIKFICNTEHPPDAVLIGDKLRINQVLINLLSNAVKFTPTGGEITFSVRTKEETVHSMLIEFTVADTGIGMREEQVLKLFNPFEQTDTSIAAKYGGTGLGLSVSQNLIEMMEGKIRVESEQGAGSVFKFELRLGKGEPVKQDAPKTAEAVDLTGKRILLVEDNEINRIIMEEILSPTSVLIDEAEDGQKAVEMFSKSEPGYYSMIFMDIRMPVMDGYEATKAIRKLNREDAKKIRIIAMTANAYTEDIEMSLAAGMDMHLSKPIDIDALMNVLSMLSE